MDKVIKMCLIHDLGECFTGDIPTFLKTASDEQERRMRALCRLGCVACRTRMCRRLAALYAEMNALETHGSEAL